ncbi:MAG: cobyrinic acid a,c-diamide synthase, partial [Rhodospirillaceae bacterium]|nr:cobyrinic acid a,c-diamide synthase [Rhodospirillaceae bacterium]
HEFHYASIMQTSGEPLFEAKDALGVNTSLVGAASGTVCGSFMHIIDAETPR